MERSCSTSSSEIGSGQTCRTIRSQASRTRTQREGERLLRTACLTRAARVSGLSAVWTTIRLGFLGIALPLNGKNLGGGGLGGCETWNWKQQP